MKTHACISLLTGLAAALLLVGCSDWVNPQKLDFYRQTPEEADPAKYAAYLDALRAYKQTAHNIMIVGMNAPASHPSSQCQHLMAMPDSADYIVVRMGETMHKIIAEEIAEVREKKCTETLLAIDYAEILASWSNLEEEKARKGEAPGTDEEAEAYFEQQAGILLARCNKFGFGGVEITFEGTTGAGFALRSHNGYMKAVKDFHSANPNKVMTFRGSARNVVDQEFLKEFRYLVIIAGANKTLSLLPGRILGYSAPTDRVVMELTVPSSEAPEQVGLSPFEAAQWLVNTKHSGYEPKGLSVSNAYDDYFNKVQAFDNVRSAISLMNPAK